MIKGGRGIEEYPAASCRESSPYGILSFLMRSLTPQQDFDDLSRVATGNALAIAVQPKEVIRKGVGTTVCILED